MSNHTSFATTTISLDTQHLVDREDKHKKVLLLRVSKWTGRMAGGVGGTTDMCSAIHVEREGTVYVYNGCQYIKRRKKAILN